MAAKGITGSQTDGDNATADEAEEEQDPKALMAKAIDVKVADAGVLRKSLTVTVPRDAIDRELDKEYGELTREAIVPGFRRGRAPRRLVEKRFGGEVGAQVQTRIVSNAYLAAIEKQDLKVLGDPLIWAVPKDKQSDPQAKEQLVEMTTYLQGMKLPAEGSLQFRCEVEVKPSFELPKLEGVEIEKPQVEINEDDINEQVDRLRSRRGHFAPVVDGKVEPNDIVVCDLVVSVGGKEVKKQENVTLAARAQRIETVAFENFGDTIKGAKVGDSRTLEGTLGDDYDVEDARGKKAKFEIKVNDIKRLQLPPLDKAFLESFGFDSEKDLREHLRRQMEGELSTAISRGMRGQARKYLLDNTKLDLPEGLSSRTVERAVVRRIVELQRQGVPMEEIEKHADELRTSAAQEALAELKLHFILEDMAEKLELDVSEEELNAQIASIAQMYGRRFDRVRDDLMKNNGIESLYLQVRDDKCLDHVIKHAVIKESKPDIKGKGEKAEKAAKAKPEKAENAETAEKSDKAPAAKKEAKAAAPKPEKKKESGGDAAKPARKPPSKK